MIYLPNLPGLSFPPSHLSTMGLYSLCSRLTMGLGSGAIAWDKLLIAITGTFLNGEYDNWHI